MPRFTFWEDEHGDFWYLGFGGLTLLKTILLSDRGKLPQQPGIYIVRAPNQTCLYVGQSVNLRKRWAGAEHHRYQQAVEHHAYLQYFVCDRAELDFFEDQMIALLKPLWNDTTYDRPNETYPLGKPHWQVFESLLNQPMNAIANDIKAWQAISVLIKVDVIDSAKATEQAIKQTLEVQGYYIVERKFSTYLIKHRTCCLQSGRSVSNVVLEFA